MLDRCRVWESHADPAVRLVSKPSPDLTYPAYVVGDADRNRVAAVTGQRSGTTQLEDLLRRFLIFVEPPALSPEVPAVEKLLQRLVTETQSRPPPVMSAPAPTELGGGNKALFICYVLYSLIQIALGTILMLFP